MIKTIFHTPQGDCMEAVGLDIMKRYVIDDFSSYWSEGSSDGYIEFFMNNDKISTLIIGPNIDHGIYLHVIDEKMKEDWISVYDSARLHEVAETADEIYASVGLFLPLQTAYEGIKQFLLHGDLSDAITWEHPDIIPEDGNW